MKMNLILRLQAYFSDYRRYLFSIFNFFFFKAGSHNISLAGMEFIGQTVLKLIQVLQPLPYDWWD